MTRNSVRTPNSQCNEQKVHELILNLKENGSLVCLARGQTLQLLSKETSLEDKNEEANLRQEGDGCPSC